MTPLQATPLQTWHVLLFIAIVMLGWVVAMVLRQHIIRLEGKVEAHRRERASVLQFLHRMGELVTSERDMETTLEVICDFLIEETGALAGAIHLIGEENGEQFLEAHAVRGYYPPLRPVTGYVLTRQKHLHRLAKAERIPKGEGAVGEVWATGKSMLIANAHNDDRISAEAQDLVQIRTMMLMPLRIRDQVVGVFSVINKRRDGDVFTEDEISFLETLADQAAVTVKIVQLYDQMTEKKRVENELQIASDFQKMMLPSEPPEVPGFEIATHSSPALEMGGDYFDFFRVDEHHLGIVIADVSGKGIPGSLIMAMVRSAIRAEAPGILSPAQVLTTINHRVHQDTRSNVFITMTYAILDERTHHLCFARAGHEPTIICGPDGAQPLLHTPEGIALGLVDDDVFSVIEDMTVDLSEAELVVLYTDGVVEAMNSEGEEYGQERFFSILQTGANTPAEQILTTLLSDIERFTRGITQHDDITLVALRRLRSTGAEQDKTKARQTG